MFVNQSTFIESKRCVNFIVCPPFTHLSQVIEAVKGGIVVLVNGANQVFVPGSHTGVPKDGDLGALVGQTVKLRIIEVKPGKKAIGSIRSVLRDERRAKEAEFWASIEEGKVYTGTFQMHNASVHVNGDYSSAKRSYDAMEVVIDEEVRRIVDEVVAMTRDIIRAERENIERIADVLLEKETIFAEDIEAVLGKSAQQLAKEALEATKAAQTEGNAEATAEETSNN